jgi:hypothetical protein
MARTTQTELAVLGGLSVMPMTGHALRAALAWAVWIAVALGVVSLVLNLATRRCRRQPSTESRALAAHQRGPRINCCPT